MRSEELKQKAKHELIEYAVNVVYLAIVFAAFTIYRRLILASYDITYTNYWVAVIEALILGKVIMIGGIFRLGRSLEDQPLIYSSLYKTAVFCVFCAVFTVAEHTVVGLWKGGGPAAGLHEMSEMGGHELMANTLMLFVSLFPFFAFKELGRVFGRDRLKEIFFLRRHDLTESAGAAVVKSATPVPPVCCAGDCRSSSGGPSIQARRWSAISSPPRSSR